MATAFTLFTRPGVFSWDHLDEARRVLAGAMESARRLGARPRLRMRRARRALRRGSRRTGSVTMVDADVEAVRSATRSAADAPESRTIARCTSDVALAVRDERFDVVVTNPPFHVGKATDLSVPLQFIHEAWECCARGGRLFLVANRTLPVRARDLSAFWKHRHAAWTGGASRC